MKKSDLHKIIREAIKEVLNEETYAGIAAVDDLVKSKKFNTLTPDAKIAAQDTLKKKGIVNLEEDNLDEFANQPGRYELSPEANAADFAGKKAQIIAAMQDNGGSMTQLDIALALGYNSQQPINANFGDLLRRGIIVPSAIQTARRPIVAPVIGGDEDEDEGPDELPSGYEDPEGGVAGDMSPEDVDAGFPKMGGSDEEEPEAEEIETSNVSAGGMSDKDYEAFMQYTDLEKRLASVKSNILKAKRSRPSMGDISDTPSNELQNLRDLKARLQTKMDGLLAGSEYLQKRQSKMTKKAEPEELSEWTKNRMQFYAGIIK